VRVSDICDDDRPMGPGIIIPVAILVIVVPTVFTWARRNFKEGAGKPVDLAPPPSARLTSNALRALPSPPWRVVYEIAADKLGGVEHVLIGPGGIYAMQTSMDPIPEPSPGDAQAIGRAAVARGPLDDALRRCAMSSTALTTVHWGVKDGSASAAVEVYPGALAVDGRGLGAWAAGLTATMTPTQVDLAWQTVVTAIGRPDPLA
jgi:hypothetical protein